VQRPALAGPTFDSLEPAAFTFPPYAAVRDVIAAAGGTGAGGGGGPEWVRRLQEASPDDGVRQLLTALAVEPFPQDDVEGRYAAELLGRLQEEAVSRLVAGLRARMQRMNPLADVEAYNRLFGELVALEQHRRMLRVQSD
jgi:DNA primase